MRLGVFTPLLSQLPLEGVLAKLKALQIDTVELATGNYPGNAHCKLSMLDDAPALKEFKRKLEDHGTSISALSCHGNPLHPDPARANEAQEVNRKTILLAEKLGVPVVVDSVGGRMRARSRQRRYRHRVHKASPKQVHHLWDEVYEHAVWNHFSQPK